HPLSCSSPPPALPSPIPPARLPCCGHIRARCTEGPGSAPYTETPPPERGLKNSTSAAAWCLSLARHDSNTHANATLEEIHAGKLRMPLPRELLIRDLLHVRAEGFVDLGKLHAQVMLEHRPDRFAIPGGNRAGVGFGGIVDRAV